MSSWRSFGRCRSVLKPLGMSRVKKLAGRRETEPLIERHGFAAGVNRHPTRPEAQGMLCCGPHKLRTNALPALFRQDEQALDVCRVPSAIARPRRTWDESQPHHADGLALGRSSDKGNMRVFVIGPPCFKVHGEGLDGLPGPLVGRRVHP